MSKKGGDLIISILTPYSWLSDKERVYPIVVDPSTTLEGFDLGIHGVVRRSRSLQNWNGYSFFDNEESELIAVGTELYSDGPLKFSDYRSYIQWPSYSIHDAFEPNYILSSIEFYYEVYSKYSTTHDTISFYEIDQDDPNELTPSSPDNMRNLYNIIDSGDLIGEETSPRIGNNIYSLNSLAVKAMNNSIQNDEDFIIGMEGECCGDNSIVTVKGVDSDNEPLLVVRYTDPDPSGQTPSCNEPDGSSYNPGCSCLSDADCQAGSVCDRKVNEPSACKIQTQCKGTIAAIVSDSSNNPISDLNVYLNGVNKGQTDDDGLKELNITHVGCGSLQSVQIKCEDDTTSCGTDSTSMDEDNDYDSVLFNCDICLSKKDLFIKDDDIILKVATGGTNITAIIHTIKIEAVNTTVRFTKVCNRGAQHADINVLIPNITSSNNYLVSNVMDLSDCSVVRVNVDPNKNISESNEKNNEGKIVVINPIKVYLNVDTGYSLVDDEIEDFIGDFVQLTSQGDSQLEIYVGRKLAPKLIEDGWGLSDNIIQYNNNKEGLPYNGIIGKKFPSGKPRLYVFGNEIEGPLAAVRRLISDQKIYLNEQVLNDETPALYLHRRNLDAISVFDYLHTDEDQASYRRNDITFAQITEKVLRRETFNLAIKRVLTSNDQTALRLKNINSELSPEYRDFVNNSIPVVIGHGLFSNLFTMEELGLEIAKDDKFGGQYVRDVWMAEYKGGPNTECDDCPNYNYGDVVDSYWPALYGGVLKYTGQNQLDFIGYSGGATGATSYDKWEDGKSDAGFYLNDNNEWELFDLPPNAIDHMVLIAPMLAFNGDTLFTKCVKLYGNEVNRNLQEIDHFTPAQLSGRFALSSALRKDKDCTLFAIGGFLYFFNDRSKTAYNFWKDLVDDVHQKNDLNPSFNSLNEIMLIRGEYGGFGDDVVIPDSDLDYVYDNSNTDEKYKARVFGFHSETWNKRGVYDPLIAKFLNDEEFDDAEKSRLDIEESL